MPTRGWIRLALAALAGLFAVTGLVTSASAHSTSATPTGTALAAGGLADYPGSAVPDTAVNKNQIVAERMRAATAAAIPGYSPAQLRAAYGLAKAAASAGSGETVAVVSAYASPKTAADLAVYRAQWKLPACTIASGCLRVLNEHGAAKPLPAGNAAFAKEQAVQLDAISALCPKCKLLVVEAASSSVADLGTAENTAVAKGARFVANGWSETEFQDELAYAHYFDHPGVAIVAAAGNFGYGSTFPAALPTVTAVGGTTLKKSSVNERGWAETAWAQTGSGCAILTSKPSWQRADAKAGTGCLNRTENDVAADADPLTGAAVYDSYSTGGGWTMSGGNALSAAIVTAVYALAGNPAPGSYPASYPYQHTSKLWDVKFGPVGALPPREYLGTAETGFDGPTGWGTPDGTGAFTAAGTDPVTVTDPGVQDREAGTAVTVHVIGLDTRTAATTLTWSAAGLPTGLSIKGTGKSAVITGVLPAAVSGYPVVVTAKDPVTGKSASTHFSIVAAASLALAAPNAVTFGVGAGYGHSWGTSYGAWCLDGGAATAGTTVTVTTPCYGTAEQLFAFQPEGAPGAPGQLLSGALCVTPEAGGIQLAACTDDTVQGWRLLPGSVTDSEGDLLQNASTGTCLVTGADVTDPLALAGCSAADGYQNWAEAGAKLVSGTGGMCVSDADTGAGGWPSTLEPCGQSVRFGIGPDNSVISSLGRCMGPGGGIGNCDGQPDDEWLWGPGGELINAGSGLCLDDPGDTATAGTELTTSDCYGTPGEIWARA